MQEVNKRHSLYFQLLLLLLAAAIASAAVFFGLRAVGNSVLSSYSENSDYFQNRNAEYVSRLQSYITKNRLSVFDLEEIDEWVSDQRILYLQIYLMGMLIYDSGYTSQDELTESDSDSASDSTQYAPAVYYTVQFTDASAKIVLVGFYLYQLETWFFIAELAVSILLFFVIVLLGIRRKMKYILTLGKEIEILEGGNLDYAITIKGRDELAGLAKSLDRMRISFQQQLEHEAVMDQENQRAVTEMSHDLRTPLTSIMLYTELLKKGKYEDAAQMQDYLDKIDRKAHQMRQLSENLFKYTLVTGGEKESESILEDPAEFKSVFFDLLSETCSALEQMGYRTECRFDWPCGLLRVNSDYLMRIMDNLISNISKYADGASPVTISIVSDQNMLGFHVENRVRPASGDIESNGVGLRSICAMMEQMNGVCRTGNSAGVFWLEILFPLNQPADF